MRTAAYILRTWILTSAFWSASLGFAAAMGAPASLTDGSGQMRSLVEQFTADRISLLQKYPLRLSAVRLDRLERFYQDELETLRKIHFEALSEDEKIDYLLLRKRITSDQHRLEIERRADAEVAPLIPFAKTIEDLDDQRRLMLPSDPEKAAGALTAMVQQIAATRKTLDPGPAKDASGHTSESGAAGKPTVDRVVANRAVRSVEDLKKSLKQYFDLYNGYDPAFTWWMDMPYKAADKALSDYESFVKERLIGIPADDKTTIIGSPVGRDALLADLSDNMVPYTPEELIAIAQTEMDWCMKEMLKASHEMGYGDDWHRALEKVKTMHVPPGEQPELIRKLVVDGSEFVKKNDMVTVPPLADESWRMIMMTPERQLVNPFFTGGDEISVSYPTDTMTFDQREMSMRGNNIPFARATAFHEMIPGHFLQFYMAQRYHPYRRAFDTGFWAEGDAFQWEMEFYDRGFERTPEERVGALFWRMHRSARVMFTMRFHLGQWTPQQCVDYLVDAVGHERENAIAEVRRSFDGSYPPLYQSAYLMGALQIRALRRELVEQKKVMTERQFHDALLQAGPMPIEMLRADLTKQKLTPEYMTYWKFYGPNPTHP